MIDRGASGRYGFSRVSFVYWAVVTLLMILLPAASGVELPNDGRVVQVRRVQKADYISVVVKNRKAHEVTVALTIVAENVSVTRITPENRHVSRQLANRGGQDIRGGPQHDVELALQFPLDEGQGGRQA